MKIGINIKSSNLPWEYLKALDHLAIQIMFDWLTLLYNALENENFMRFWE